MAETVVVKLRLSEELYDQYAERAQKFGRTVEQELILRLKNCRDHTDVAPLYFSDADRASLQKIIGHVISSPEMALDRMRRLLSVKVDNVEVVLPDKIQQRLMTRVFRGDTREKMMQRVTIKAFAQECGLG